VGATVSPEPQADTFLCRKRISGPNVTPRYDDDNDDDDDDNDDDDDGPPPPPPPPPLLFLLRPKPPPIPNSGNDKAAAAAAVAAAVAAVVDPPPRCIPCSAGVSSLSFGRAAGAVFSSSGRSADSANNAAVRWIRPRASGRDSFP
jgi:hypothetical protein